MPDDEEEYEEDPEIQGAREETFAEKQREKFEKRLSKKLEERQEKASQKWMAKEREEKALAEKTLKEAKHRKLKKLGRGLLRGLRFAGKEAVKFERSKKVRKASKAGGKWILYGSKKKRVRRVK